MKNTNEMNEFVNRNSLVEGQSKSNRRTTLNSRLSTFTSRLSTLVLIVFCLFFGGKAWGQTTATFNDGTTTMSYVPFYGLYADYGAKGQFIIPATDLANKGITSGCTISKLKFFSNATSTGTYFGSSVKVEVGEVANATFSSSAFVTSGLITVFSGTSLSRSADGTMVVEFTSDYTYNGGNLLISIGGYGSGCPSTSWYGVSSTDAGVYGYNSSNNQTIPSSASSKTPYAPKTVITYSEPPTTPFVTLSPSSATVLTGFTQNLTATTYNVTGTPNISYTSSNTSVATVSSSGTTATVTGVAPGTCTITATMTYNNNTYTATCAITVEDPSYCTPNPSSVDGVGITTLTFGSGDYVVNNSNASGLPSSSPFYADYTSMIGSVDACDNSTVSITYTTWSYTYYNYGTIIWVDWNKNYIFEDSEIVFAGQSSQETNPTGAHTLNATFSVPANQAADDYRMRIAGADSYFDSYIGGDATANHSPCFSSTYAVCHDYTLRVISDACPRPISLAAGTPGPRSVELSWTAQGSETQWQICLNGNESSPTLVSDNPYTLTGLTPETTYTVKVRAYCDASDQSNWSNEISFTTDVACPAPTGLTALDITDNSAELSWTGSADSYNVRYRPVVNDPILFEDFEDGLPAGWISIDSDGDGNSWEESASVGNFYCHSGSNCMISASYDDDNGSALNPDNWLITSQIELQGILRVWLRGQEDNENYNSEHFAIYLSTSGTNVSDFTTVLVPESITTSDYQEFSADLSAYTGQYGYIAIRHFNCSDQYWLDVDDFGIYSTAPWLPNGSGENNESNSLDIDQLTSETEYEWQVQSDCGSDGESNWSQIATFTTLSPCATPNGLTADPLSSSATLRWSGAPENYNVRYGKVFYEDFENGIPATWTTIDADGDGNNWLALSEIPTVYSAGYGSLDLSQWAHGGSDAASSPSYENGSGAFDSDHWLITPQIDFGGFLRFYVTSAYSDEYEVLLSTTGTETTDFVTTLKSMTAATDSWDEVTIDLSSYAGQHGYIAIHHVFEDGYFFVVDDFGIYYDMQTTTANARPFTINGLEPETDYAWQVQGTNCDGNGATTDWSDYGYFTTLPEYTVSASVNPTGAGTITGEGFSNGSGVYTQGTTCTLTATADDCHTFENWTENDVEVSSDATYSFTVTGDRTLVANFTNRNYTLTIIADEGGTVTGAGDYDCFTPATLTATPDDCHIFRYWKDPNNVTYNMNPLTPLSVDHDITFIAHFELRPALSASIANATDYCRNISATALSTSPAGGSENYSYQWQSSADNSEWSSTGTNSNECSISTASVGTTYYRVIVTDTHGCGTATAESVQITVNDKPSVSLSQPAAVCSGENLTLTASVTDDGGMSVTDSYEISADNSDWDSFTNGSAVTDVQNNCYIKYTAENGCGSSSKTVQITVHSLPDVPTISGPTEVCPGKTAKLTTPQVSGVTFSWNGGSFGSSREWTTPAITSTTAFTLVAKSTSNGCPSQVATKSVAMTVPTDGERTTMGIEDGYYVWTGNNSNWNGTNNWMTYSSAGSGTYTITSTPVSANNVVIGTYGNGACASGSPTLNINANANANNLTVGNGITISATSKTLTVAATLTNNGTINGTKTIKAKNMTNNGTVNALLTVSATLTNNGTINGTRKTTTKNLINNSNGTFTVAPLTISGSLENNGTFNAPVVFNGTTTLSGSSAPTFSSVTINPGKTFKFYASGSSVNAIVTGNWTNDGTFNANKGTGSIIFAGTSSQTIGGTNRTTFKNVEFANEYGISASLEPTISGKATFTSGIVTGDVTFGGSATISGVSTNRYVNGKVTKLMKANKTFTFPTGTASLYAPFYAKSSAESNVSVQYASGHEGMPDWWNHSGNLDAVGLSHASDRENWQISASASTSLSGIKLYWNAGGDHSFEEGNAALSSYLNVAAVQRNGFNWQNLGSTSVSGSWDGSGSITASNPLVITVGAKAAGDGDYFITFASSNKGGLLLPIELTSFTATCDGRSALVEWTTATERNNDYFSLERSDDAINFTEIARVAGAGNSIEPLNYSYTDYGIHGGDNYYRLVQVDYDGTRTVSEVIVANCIEPEVGEPDVLAYPNPFNGELTLVLDNFSNRAATIEVYDMLGKLIYTEKASAPQNSYETILNLSNLPSGAYTVRVSTTDFVINRNVVKQ